VNPPKRVGIIGGTSRFRHLGDDMITRAHLHQLAALAPHCEPVILHPGVEELSARFGVRVVPGLHDQLLFGWTHEMSRRSELKLLASRTATLLMEARRLRAGRPPGPRSASWRPHLAELARLDLLVAASAGSLTSSFSAYALWPQMVTLLAARALRVPVVVSGVTVGPFRGLADRVIAALGLRTAAAITVRDSIHSPRALRMLGVPPGRVQCRPDDATALEPAPAAEVEQALAVAGLGDGRRFFALSMHEWDGLEESLRPLAELVDWISAERGLTALFVPHVTFELHDDRALARRLAGRLGAHVDLRLLDPLPADEVLMGIIGRAELAVGTRFHQSVIASARGVPALGIHGDAYTRIKLEGLAAMAGGVVSAVPATSSPERLVAEATRLLEVGRGTPLRAPTLPEIDYLLEREDHEPARVAA
jgi:polysaccharide pyruvyl transferase WcaK-like protein